MKYRTTICKRFLLKLFFQISLVGKFHDQRLLFNLLSWNGRLTLTLVLFVFYRTKFESLETYGFVLIGSIVMKKRYLNAPTCMITAYLKHLRSRTTSTQIATGAMWN